MTTTLLTLSDFAYDYPEHLVAQQPRPDRDQARLLVRSPDGHLKDSHVVNLVEELEPGTLLIMNDSRVFPSRLFGQLPTGGQVELFLLEPLASEAGAAAAANTPQTCGWKAMGRPLKKLKPGTTILLAAGMQARVLAKSEDGAGNAFVDLAFASSPTELEHWLDQHGYVPLPPYIRRPDPVVAADSGERERYQTVYAQERGSVAAPTAGLHFTTELLSRLTDHGVELAYVSLHVGAGTFLPVKTEDPASHKMHAERYRVSRSTAAALVKAKAEGRRVVTVGTTTLRSLEDLYRQAGGDPERFVALSDSWRSTDLYLRPSTMTDCYRPWVTDGVFTNFHQPCSTLFMLVSALLRLPEARRLYRSAIEREYLLYSYGDACLLWLGPA